MRKFRGYASLAGSDHVEIEFEVPDDATPDQIEAAAQQEAIAVLCVSYSEVGKPSTRNRGKSPISDILSDKVIERYIRSTQ
jgi:hypothetical protein